MVYADRAFSGRIIRPIALGTAGWSFTEGLTHERILDTAAAALERGPVLIDTAYAYTTLEEQARSDRLVGEVKRHGGDDVMISAKGGHYRDATGFPIDGRPETIRRHAEASLQAMGVEAVELYSLHRVDPRVPIEDSIGAIDDLRREGKVHHVGVSNVSLDQLRAAAGVTQIAAVQNRFSPYVRDSLDVVEEVHETGMLFLAYSPTKPGPDTPPALVEAIRKIATYRRISPQQVALAWTMWITAVPIIGSTRRATVEDSFGALDVVFETDELEWIESASSVTH